MPLFLELVRQASKRDAPLARRALAGLDAYEKAPRTKRREATPAISAQGGAVLRDHGGVGPPLILVPSLINPPHILDLDKEVSLADTLAAQGRRVLLLDWGDARDRAGLDVGGHVEQLLVPLMRSVGEPAVLVGYCLGGTMTIAAAGLEPVKAVVTLASPWHFSRYPADSRAALAKLWDDSRAAANQLGALPMEVLQAGFWALDPERTVRKFAEFAALDPQGDQARRFTTLEDWANEGEPLPLPAARELFEDLYRDDAPGNGTWTVGGCTVRAVSPAPALHLVAGQDRIVPAATAPEGKQAVIPSGHVGMIVGRARTQLHGALRAFLAS